jgi:hypothetical protein
MVISLNSIYRFMIVMEAKCVFCKEGICGSDMGKGRTKTKALSELIGVRRTKKRILAL